MVLSASPSWLRRCLQRLVGRLCLLKSLGSASARTLDRHLAVEDIRHFAGPKKGGVHDLVVASPRVIDVEISVAAAAPHAAGADDALGGADLSGDPKARQ
jgi:hypothetical protein